MAMGIEVSRCENMPQTWILWEFHRELNGEKTRPRHFASWQGCGGREERIRSKTSNSLQFQWILEAKHRHPCRIVFKQPLYNIFYTRNLLKWRTETNDGCGIQVKISRMDMPTMKPTVNEGPIWAADCEYDLWRAWLWASGCECEFLSVSMRVWQCRTWYILALRRREEWASLGYRFDLSGKGNTILAIRPALVNLWPPPSLQTHCAFLLSSHVSRQSIV